MRHRFGQHAVKWPSIPESITGAAQGRHDNEAANLCASLVGPKPETRKVQCKTINLMRQFCFLGYSTSLKTVKQKARKDCEVLVEYTSDRNWRLALKISAVSWSPTR